MKFRNVEDEFVWMFTRVYGPFSREERGWLWEELGAIRGLWNDPWCLGGDFNVILSQRERSRGLVRGNASFRLATKLKELKQRIKVWNRDVFGRLELLSEEPGWRADIEELHLHRLNFQEAENLEVPFSEDEIHSALLASVLGFCKEGNLGVVQRVEEGFRKVVSEDQNAFVKGRHIVDVSLIANEVLHKMGFGSWWMEWIWRCISIAKFSVLVNGVPTGFFSSTKGLRQGDPLSPYLFVLRMEVLSAFLRRVADGGFISGCKLRGRGRMELNVSYLLFADDTIIFCKARKENLTFLSWTLAWFEVGSGLRINLAKSELIPVGETVCTQKEKGGLGLRKIILLNKVLLGKWVWRFAIEKDNLWKKVLLVKYDQEGFGWRTNEVRGTYGVGVWKEILKEACCVVPNLPPVITLAVHRNATVNEVWDSSFGQREEDSIFWKGGGSGIFGVKDAYILLVTPNDFVFPKKNICVDKAPTKAVFFAWEATWGKILTLDSLQKPGWQLTYCCFLCGCEEETVLLRRQVRDLLLQCHDSGESEPFEQTTASVSVAESESNEIQRFELLRKELIELEKRVQRSTDQSENEEDVKVTVDNATYRDEDGVTQLVQVQKKENIIEKSFDKLKEASTDVWQGTQLLAIDVAAATGLIRRVLIGDELTEKEKKALQRTLTDLASVVPIGVLMLLPVTAVGHAAILAAIQRYVPALIPSTYGPERLDLLRQLEKMKEMETSELNTEENVDELA
ncbi:putative mitochondrial protein [Vitis vinifera]|uniref:Putative mitochondrial protein n=1 Tax=Vitis vinifera TaxID=29760 RepID=A0A438EKA3_VITVI|nr:putative mitochondrial protein [Vitis vinifera]